jgi:apolipoprotein N-acyltransferase
MRNPVLMKLALYAFGFAGMLLYIGDWRVWPIAWITPVALLWLVRSGRWWSGLPPLFVLSIGASMIARQGLSPMGDWVSLLISSVMFAFTFCIPFLVDRLLYRRLPGLTATLVFPSTLVALELLAASGKWGGWCLLAHTQFALPVLMQTASLFGAFAVTFLVAWFAPVVLHVIAQRHRRRSWATAAGVYAGILVALLVFGALRLELGGRDRRTVPVAAIINETDLFGMLTEPDRAREYLSSEEVIAHQLERTEQAAAAGARLIAWHEGSLVVDPASRERVIAGISDITRANDVYVSASYMEIVEGPEGKPFRNRTVLVAPDGEVKWTYDKSRPVPMVELPHVEAGDGVIPVLDTEYGRLGVVICFDMEFYDLLRQASRKKIDILLVPGADWEGITPIHTYMASMEGIQNGFSLVRICGHGFTGMFDGRGALLAGMNSFETDSDILLAHVPTRRSGTLYTYLGHSFAAACVVFLIGSVLGVAVAAVRRRLGQPSAEREQEPEPFSTLVPPAS